MVLVTSCKDDDDDDKPPVQAEDGIYVTGAATGLNGLVLKGMMMPGREEGEGYASNLRDGMYEKLMYLTAGNFNIVEKAGANESTYGWKDGTYVAFESGGGDEINCTVHKGEFVANGAAFNAPSNGFYHIILDKTTGTAYFTKIDRWAVIGDATDMGWSTELEMTTKTLTAEAAEWEITQLTLRARGGFKFRYNGGWKFSTGDFVIFGNIGKAGDSNDFIMGGGTFPYPTDAEGEYTVVLSWSIDNGFSYTTTRTGDVEPLPEYPDNLFIIGDGLHNGGWTWGTNDMPMIPVHSNPHLFWRIVWLNGTGAIEFSPVQEWNGNFGGTALVDGISEIVWAGMNAIAVPATPGYYMVVVNLEEEKVAVVDPKVYLIGNTVSSWDTANPNALFTVDNANDVVTITKELAADELRMYAWFDVADWFTKPFGGGTQVSWWQAEFMIFDGVIEYRGAGGDQARISVTAGEHTISLNFKTGGGVIN